MQILKKAVKAPTKTMIGRWNEIYWPKYLSSKKDGIRCLIPPRGIPTGHSGKPIRNPRFIEHFAALLKYATAEDMILDGEIWSENPNLTSYFEYLRIKSETSFIECASIGVGNV